MRVKNYLAWIKKHAASGACVKSTPKKKWPKKKKKKSKKKKRRKKMKKKSRKKKRRKKKKKRKSRRGRHRWKKADPRIQNSKPFSAKTLKF